MANSKIITSAKKQRLVAYNSIITTNKAKLKAGKTMSRVDFVALFGITKIVNKGSYAKVHRANLRLVQAQAEINALMAENGLYLSSRDYYNEFYVRDKNYTKHTIERFSNEVDVYSACTSRLEVNLTQRVTAGTWGRYNKLSAAKVDSIASKKPKSARHQQVIQRIKMV